MVVFYSMYGHIYRMAQAVVEGAKEVPGTEVTLRRVPETLSDEILGKVGSVFASSATQHGGQGQRLPSENELDAARFQGKHVAEIAAKLAR